MSFICQQCYQPIPPASPSHRVITGRRVAVYPPRSFANRPGIYDDSRHDPGGSGEETVGEKLVCGPCKEALGINAYRRSADHV